MMKHTTMADDIASSMLKNIEAEKSAKRTTKRAKVDIAMMCLNKAAEIFDDLNLSNEASVTTILMEKIAWGGEPDGEDEYGFYKDIDDAKKELPKEHGMTELSVSVEDLDQIKQLLDDSGMTYAVQGYGVDSEQLGDDYFDSDEERFDDESDYKSPSDLEEETIRPDDVPYEGEEEYLTDNMLSDPHDLPHMREKTLSPTSDPTGRWADQRRDYGPVTDSRHTTPYPNGSPFIKNPLYPRKEK